MYIMDVKIVLIMMGSECKSKRRLLKRLQEKERATRVHMVESELESLKWQIRRIIGQLKEQRKNKNHGK